MLISQIMTTYVHMVSPDDLIQTAARMMADNDIGMLPVAEKDRLIGAVTDRDITTRAVALGLQADQCQVRDVMTFDVDYVYEDETTDDAARAMGDLKVRRLPVLSRKNRLVGILALGDLSLSDQSPAADALVSISQPRQWASHLGPL